MQTKSPRLAAQSGRVWPFFLVVIAASARYAWWYFAPDALPDPLRKLLPASARANPVLYKWRDAKGRWNVTDTPPADRPYETLKYDPKTNVVPTVVPPPPPPEHR
jgi:Domain of unknown function (DUF4124)